MKNFFRKLSFSKLLLVGLIIRLILLPLSYHSDLNTNAIWGIYAHEFGLRGFYDWLNFGNYARPDYPPLAMVMFLNIRRIWEILFNFLWGLNISIPVFPSNFIPWFETKGYLSLIKLPGIIADLGISFLIYGFIKKLKGEMSAKVVASYFLFNPAVIYLSSSWGQLDSIVSFFGLGAVILILRKRYWPSLSSYFVSIMIKATYVPLALVLGVKALKEKIGFRKLLGLGGVLLLYLFTVGAIFYDKSFVLWTINTYINKVLPGAVTLPYLNLNAYNFWGLILGLERIPDNTLYFGLSLKVWAWALTTIAVGLIILKFITTFKKTPTFQVGNELNADMSSSFRGNPALQSGEDVIKGKDIFFTFTVLYFALFMFMPRVHERYLYPVFVFFPLVLAILPKLKKYFFVLSGIFLLNLYHWWWFPKISGLVYILDLDFVERGLSFLNLILFGLILKKYLLNKK